MVLHPYIRRAVANIKSRIVPRYDRVLFSVTGGSRGWPGMGEFLYRREATFRDSIDECSSAVEEVLGCTPVERFDGKPRSAATPERTQRNRIIDVGLLQIAQIDLWRREGVGPGGVLSVSMGDVIAPYAAGSFSRRDCARVLAVVSHAVTRSRSPDRMFVLSVNASQAERLCRTAPATLDYIGCMDHTSSTVLGREADAEVLRHHLRGCITRETATEWSFHTPRLDVDSDWMRDELRDVRVLPPRCPIYTATAGGRLPADAPFDFRFFTWMAQRAYHFCDAASAALNDDFDAVISLGPNADTARGVVSCAKAQRRSVRFIESMRAGDEPGSWKQALADTRDIRRRKGPPRAAPLTARTVDLASAAVQARLPEVHEELRAGGGVHFIERNGYWVLLNHADVLSALAQPGLFSSSVPSVEQIDPVLLGSDPPAHTAIRRILARHFASPQLTRRAELARKIAEELLQPLREGRQIEVVSEFARPLVERVGADVLGLDADAAAALGQSTRADGGDVRHVHARLDSTLDAVLHLSTTYAWLRSADGGALDGAAAKSLIRLLWIAGTDTLKRALPAAVLLLLKDEEVRARVEADPALVERFVDEVLRLGPAEQEIVRVTTEHVQLGGAAIPAGALVRLSLAAANRDPARFPDPYAVRLDRPAGAHLAFGGGVHRCLGAAQARSHLSIAVRVLLHLAPRFRAVQPLETIRTSPGGPLAGIEQLWIEG